MEEQNKEAEKTPINQAHTQNETRENIETKFLEAVMQGNFEDAILAIQEVKGDPDYKEKLINFIEKKEEQGVFDRKFESETAEKELPKDSNTEQTRETKAYEHEHDPFQATPLWDYEKDESQEKKVNEKETTPPNKQIYGDSATKAFQQQNQRER